MSHVLHLRDVRSSYQQREVIKGISLSVRPGETVTIVGPNGAGKSTILKLVAGLAPVTTGKILLDDREITSLEPYQRRRIGIGYLLQGGRSFPSLSVQENLALGALTLPSKDRQQSIRETAEMLELEKSLPKPAAILSGGQRQRLALAIVLVGKPRLLLLDEPSTGVDPLLVSKIFRDLAAYQRRYDVAMVLVEQQTSRAIELANRVVVLKSGQIVMDKNHERSSH